MKEKRRKKPSSKVSSKEKERSGKTRRDRSTDTEETVQREKPGPGKADCPQRLGLDFLISSVASFIMLIIIGPTRYSFFCSQSPAYYFGNICNQISSFRSVYLFLRDFLIDLISHISIFFNFFLFKVKILSPKSNFIFLRFRCWEWGFYS